MIDIISVNVSGTQSILPFGLFSQYNVKWDLGVKGIDCVTVGTTSRKFNLQGNHTNNLILRMIVKVKVSLVLVRKSVQFPSCR